MKEDMCRKSRPFIFRKKGRGFLISTISSEGDSMNTVAVKKKNTLLQTRSIAGMAMLAAVSYLLAFLEFNVPLSPPFAMMDISDLPALIGAMAINPFAGVILELVKNLLQLFSTSTAGIGELANFIIGASFVFSAGMLYHKAKWKAWLSCLVGSAVMAVVAAVTNYFILLPMFSMFMPIDQVIASFGTFIPFIKTQLDVVLYNVIPFNFLKGIVISAITLPVFRKLAPVLAGPSAKRKTA
jgi:riboflavin transporter